MNNIRRIRRELEMSQEKLAEKAGISRQTINAYEKMRGRVAGAPPMRPTEESKEKIAAALGRTVEEVFPKWQIRGKQAVKLPDAPGQGTGAVRFV